MSTISNTRLIISILQQIPRHPSTISVNDLRERILEHEGLDIPIRNMQRYLSQVKGHFGLECTEAESGTAKMWFVENIERRNPNRNSLPNTQAINYLIAQKILMESAPKSVTKQFEPLFSQAQFSLKTKGKGFAVWDKKIKIINNHLPIVRQSITQDIVDTLIESVLKEVQVELIYKTAEESHPTKYLISPLGMIIKGSSYYVVGIDERSSAKITKHFLIKEILECQATETNIDECHIMGPKAFDLDAYSEKVNFISTRESEEITLIAEVTRQAWEELETNPISENQKLDNKTDGDTETRILSATLYNSDSLKRWILGHAGNITIIEPLSLREDIQNSCVNAANNYRALSNEALKRLG